MVSFLSESATDSNESYEDNRAKYSINDTVLGLHAAGGKDQARRATRRLVWGRTQGLYPKLGNVVLVRDLNSSSSTALHQGLKQQISELASREDANFEPLGDGPWLCRVQNVAVGQILLGDPSTTSKERLRVTGGGAAIEDHILELLKDQHDRDPSTLTPVVGSHLNINLSPKQQVLLAMVRYGRLIAPSAFYEKVLGSASDDQLRSLADRVGFTELMERITDGESEG